MKPRDELHKLLADALVERLVGRDEPLTEDSVCDAVAAVIEKWDVKRKSKIHKDDVGFFDGSNMMRNTEGTIVAGSFLEIETPWRSDTEEETLIKQRRNQAFMWEMDASSTYELDGHSQAAPGPTPEGVNDPGPPPNGVGFLALLDQRIWWRKSTRLFEAGEKNVPTVAIRIDDMTHSHRMNLLGYLYRNAERLKSQYEDRTMWSMTGPLGPSGDMAQLACERELGALLDESASHWLERQPFVRELIYRTTPWGDSPLTWRPMNEAPRNETVVVRSLTDDSAGEMFAERRFIGGDWEIVGNTFMVTIDPENYVWRAITPDEKRQVRGWTSMHEGDPRDGSVIVVLLDDDSHMFVREEEIQSSLRPNTTFSAWIDMTTEAVVNDDVVDRFVAYRRDVSTYCGHEGYEHVDCEICGDEYYYCIHGGTHGSDYCGACEQE